MTKISQHQRGVCRPVQNLGSETQFFREPSSSGYPLKGCLLFVLLAIESSLCILDVLVYKGKFLLWVMLYVLHTEQKFFKYMWEMHVDFLSKENEP